MAAWACDVKSELESKPTAFSWLSDGFVRRDALALKNEQGVDVGKLGKKRVVDSLFVTLFHALNFHDEFVAGDRSRLKVGERTARELRFERSEHFVDRGRCRVVTFPRQHDQGLERGQVKRLGGRGQQLPLL